MPNPGADADSIERVMRAELSHGDAMIGTIVPIIRHLVASDDQSVFSEEIVARTRGMLEHVARQLLAALAVAENKADSREHDRAALEPLLLAIAADPALLAHVHALALEWQLTERVHARLGLDPVLSPLLQSLIASHDPGTAASAMNLLAAQARFTQSQRRMQLPLRELPADVLHAALAAMTDRAGADDEAADRAELAISAEYDEGNTRLGLMARLIMGMGGGAMAALSIEHAGVAMFLSALSIASGQDRSLTTLSTNESQIARLALALAAAGLKPQVVEQQFLSLHPEVSLPAGFEALGPDQAAAILAHGAGYPG
ncbi:MAG: hypothetical protein ABI673_10575 [Novosphingobium sp.]